MVTVIGTATDVDDAEASLRYAWSQLAAAPAGAPALDLAPSDRAELTFAAPSVAAEYLLQLRVNDPAGAHSTDTVRLRIGDGDLSPPNQSPVARAQQLVVAEDATLEVTLGGSDSDGGLVAFEVILQPVHGTLSGTGATRIYRRSADYFGADQLQFVVIDDDGAASAAETIGITVTPVNDAPVADAGDDLSADTGSMVTVIGTATDPDDAEADLSFAWSQLAAAPAGAPALDLTPAGAMVTFTSPERETVTAYTLQLRVTDDEHAAASDTVTITVSNRTPPPAHLAMRGVPDGVNVSVVDGIGFGPGQHGAQVTETFEANTTQASLTQISNLLLLNLDGYATHVTRHNDGIFWTATDQSPAYVTGEPGWFVEDGRPFTTRAMNLASWMEHQNVLFVTSLENYSSDSAGNNLYCDDVQNTFYFIPLCGELDDYIAHSGTGLNNTVFAGALGSAGVNTWGVAAIRPYGVFAADTVYAPGRPPSGGAATTSYAAAALAATATNIAAELAARDNRLPTASEIKTELFSRTVMKRVENYPGGERCIRVIGLDESRLAALPSCTR